MSRRLNRVEEACKEELSEILKTRSRLPISLLPRSVISGLLGDQTRAHGLYPAKAL